MDKRGALIMGNIVILANHTRIENNCIYIQYGLDDYIVRATENRLPRLPRLPITAHSGRARRF